MSMIRRFPVVRCLVVLLALLGATLGCKEGCGGEHDCDCEKVCDCGETEPIGGAGGQAGAPGTGGEDSGEGGGEPVLRPNDADFDTLDEDPFES